MLKREIQLAPTVPCPFTMAQHQPKIWTESKHTAGTNLGPNLRRRCFDLAPSFACRFRKAPAGEISSQWTRIIVGILVIGCVICILASVLFRWYRPKPNQRADRARHITRPHQRRPRTLLSPFWLEPSPFFEFQYNNALPHRRSDLTWSLARSTGRVESSLHQTPIMQRGSWSNGDR